MPLQPARAAWLAIAAILRSRAAAIAAAPDAATNKQWQRGRYLSLAAAILEREAPPAKPRTEPTKREAKKTTAAKRKQRPARDAAYRAALGVEPGQPLPPTAGTANSAGAARGGRGASRRGRGTHK
jgi:hypothetical protein